MLVERRCAEDEMRDDIVTTDGRLIPTFDELQEINDEPTVDFEKLRYSGRTTTTERGCCSRPR